MKIIKKITIHVKNHHKNKNEKTKMFELVKKENLKKNIQNMEKFCKMTKNQGFYGEGL